MIKILVLCVIVLDKDKKKLFKKSSSETFIFGFLFNITIVDSGKTGKLKDAVEVLRKAGAFKKQKEIAEKTGFDEAVISNYLSGRVAPSRNFLEKFSEVFKINLDSPSVVTEPQKPYGKYNGRGIPYLGELDIFAGKMDVANSDLSEHITGHISIPGFRDADYFVNVRGHSAYPKYAQGDMIAIKLIDMAFIQYGQFYVVVTKQDRVLKKVRKSPDPEWLLLKSENPEFDDIEVKRKDVKNMFLVLGKITKDVL